MILHPDVQALLDAMRALEFYLRDKSDFWSANIRRAADEVARSDAYGLQRFLTYFGGMGSLNDLVLQRDGVPVESENDQFERLRQRAWTLAYNLRHETA